jgi:hypothetical protein
LNFTRWTKIWVTITLCSLLTYGLYWVFSVISLIYRTFSLQLPRSQGFYYDILPGATGDILRVIGVCLSLFAIYLYWGPKSKSFGEVKKYFAVAILFEAIFWLLASPVSIIALFRLRAYWLLSLAYVLQIILVSILLLFLSIKIWRAQIGNKHEILRWGVMAAIGYLIGIWLINVFRWFGMAQSSGLGFLFSGTTSLGFLNSILTLSISLIFAFSGFYIGLKSTNRKFAIRLSALALIMLGLFFVIFFIYTSFTNSWNYLLITEIWPMTLLGLGIGMLRGEI